VIFGLALSASMASLVAVVKALTVVEGICAKCCPHLITQLIK
jgi:hypothetical protein